MNWFSKKIKNASSSQEGELQVVESLKIVLSLKEDVYDFEDTMNQVRTFLAQQEETLSSGKIEICEGEKDEFTTITLKGKFDPMKICPAILKGTGIDMEIKSLKTGSS